MKRKPKADKAAKLAALRKKIDAAGRELDEATKLLRRALASAESALDAFTMDGDKKPVRESTIKLMDTAWVLSRQSAEALAAAIDHADSTKK